MKNEIYEPHQSSFGNISANVMALICYAAPLIVSFIPILRYAAWLIPLALFFMEKDSRFIRFHAMQSFFLHVAGAALALLVSLLLGGIVGAGSVNVSALYAASGLIGLISLLTGIISIAILVFAVIAMVGAYRWKETHIPVIGALAEKF